MKGLFKNAWEQSDSKATFIRALEENGLFLAKGDKRGYVALDLKGGIYSLTRWIDVGTRELKARLGPPEELPSIERAKKHIADRMTEETSKPTLPKRKPRQRKNARLWCAKFRPCAGATRRSARN
ncbi:MAG: hypothetical protein PW788_06725 [Micavibrio sp.]|nr:hypothetical protein [Micavibrio sp.]